MPPTPDKVIDLAEINERAARRIARARTKLIMEPRFVFWSTLVMHLEPQPALWCPTHATDGVHLFYNPINITNPKFTDADVLFDVAHEAAHCAFAHMTRRGDREPKRWNIAADRSINPVLETEGLRPSPPMRDAALFQAKDIGRAVEDIYREVTPQDVAKYFQEGSGEQAGRGSVGSRGEVLNAPHGPENGLADDPSLAASELAARWDMITRQAAYAAHAQGHLPDQFAHLLKPVKPRLDPRALLRRFLTMSSRNDYSWSRPNRRFVEAGVYVPSLRSESVGEVCIGIDTSGSVSNDVVSRFLGFVNSVLLEVKPEKAWLLQCDAAIASAACFGAGEALPREVNVKGRGGTDMRPIWAWQRHRKLKPVCTIVLSDMEMNKASFGPKGGPGHPVLWISSSPGARAPFGVIVEMPE